MNRSKTIWFVISVLVVASMVLTACGGPTPVPTTQAPAAQPTAKPAEPTAKPAEPTAAAPQPTAAPVGPAAYPPAKDPTTYNVMTFGDPSELDPHYNYETAGGGQLFNIYQGLVSFDGKDPTKFKAVLAEAIPDPTPTEDGGVQYVWNIKKGVKFHEGQTMTPEDVAYSFWRVLLMSDPNTPGFLMTEPFFKVFDAAELADPSGAADGDAEALKALPAAKLEAACETVKAAITFDNDAGTVTMKLAQPWGPFIATIAQRWASVINKEWAVANKAWDGDCKTWQNSYGIPSESLPLRDKTNGTGPYKLDHWTPQEEIVLVANDDYWGEKPVIKRVVTKNVTEFGTRFAALQAADADRITPGSPADWAQLDTLVREECNPDTGECKEVNPDGVLRKINPLLSLARTDIGMNENIAEGSPFVGSGKLDGEGIPLNFFSDVHIRKAFNYCFDYDTYIKDVMFGEATKSLALTLPGQPGYDGTPRYEYDLAKCEEEFKASTITGTLESGETTTVWDTGFYVQLGYNVGNTARQSIAEILAENLGKVNQNFLVNPIALPWATYLRVVRVKQIPLGVAGWQEDIHDPHNWYVPYLLTTYGSRFNLAPEMVEKYKPLIDAGAKEIDFNKRAEIYKQLNQMIYDDAPYIIMAILNNRSYEQLYMKGW
ncbi:MAG TPA: ABC transporter substrate-binding protein, partial [Anaerolineae bacterium]|nr:ABC transporter substrate-binding protein [Anaerolineae bacterium]